MAWQDKRGRWHKSKERSPIRYKRQLDTSNRLDLTKSTFWNVYTKDFFTCQLCGEKYDKEKRVIIADTSHTVYWESEEVDMNGNPIIKHFEVDHRIALCNGGTNHMYNLWTLCDQCHKAKTKIDLEINRRRDIMFQYKAKLNMLKQREKELQILIKEESTPFAIMFGDP